MSDLIPDWPITPLVKSVSTSRQNGHSQHEWKGLNLGQHVGDDPALVEKNRNQLIERYALPAEPVWLNQVHGNEVRYIEHGVDQLPDVDAVWTDRPGVVLSVMSADCLPVLFAAKSGSAIAAAHAGWRGLAGGILERTMAQLPVAPEDVLVWLGPAIGPRCFEVGSDVRDCFLQINPQWDYCFVSSGRRPEKYYADIFELARLSLQRAGAVDIFGGSVCTFCDKERFYSHRRDAGKTGRMATLVWLSQAYYN